MREHQKPTKDTVAGSLLLAHPTMRDPNFRRRVVLMSVHNDEGAMGVVLNHPIGKNLGELNGHFALGALAGVPIFKGGPVHEEQLIIAVWQAQPDGFRLHFGVEPSKAEELLKEEGTHVRAFLGYAGWSAGQLEEELARKTWVVTDVPEDLMTQGPDDVMWRTVLAREGAEWRLLAEEPEEPGAN